MSFNVRYGTAKDGANRWANRRGAAFEVVRAFRPHLLALQEALDFQIGEFLESLPGYMSVGVGRDDGRAAGEFAAILVDTGRLKVVESGTFWLSDAPEEPGSRHEGCYHPRICTWAATRDIVDDRCLRIYNVHLDNASDEARTFGVDLLLRRIDRAAGGTIVAGDFNAGEGDPCVVAMRSAGFQDSYRVIRPEEPNVSTYHGFGQCSETDKIDYVWVDRSWTVLDAGIVRDRPGNLWPSDHYPVTATLAASG